MFFAIFYIYHAGEALTLDSNIAGLFYRQSDGEFISIYVTDRHGRYMIFWQNNLTHAFFEGFEHADFDSNTRNILGLVCSHKLDLTLSY